MTPSHTKEERKKLKKYHGDTECSNCLELTKTVDGICAECRSEKSEWKWIKGYVGLYKISPEGDVLSFHAGSSKLLKWIVCAGRPTVNLRKNNVKESVGIARLVALHYLPNPKGLPNVGHKDENTMNNELKNLYWTTTGGFTSSVAPDLVAANGIEKTKEVVKYLKKGNKTCRTLADQLQRYLSQVSV